MSVSVSKLKTRAKKTLEGKYGISVGAVCVLGAVMILMTLTFLLFIFLIRGYTFSFLYYVDDKTGLLRSAISITGSILWLVFFFILIVLMLLLNTGVTKLFFNMCTGMPYKLTDLLYAFKTKPGKFIRLSLLLSLINLVAGIPYLVISWSAAMTGYIPLMVILMILMYVLQLSVIIWVTLNLSMSQLILIESPDKHVLQCLKENRMMMKGNKRRMTYLILSFFGIVLLGYFSGMIAFLWLYPYMLCTVIHFYLDMKAENQEELSYR